MFIGTGLDTKALHAALTDCLTRPGEYLPGDDPFPAWDTHGIDEACGHEHAA